MRRALVMTALCGGCLLSACSTSWKLTDRGTVDKVFRYGIRVETPENWYQRNFRRTTLFTRNGLALEYIMLESHKWHDSLTNGFPLPHDILLHEIPEIILGEYCARNYAFNLAIISNEIVIIDSVPCALTRYRHTAPNSLTKQGVMYCIPFRRFLTILTYEAESTHYFDRSIDEFSEVARSIVVRRKKYRALPGILGREEE